MEGRILGNRYELIEKIGGGGMAIVYKAKCRLLNRFVAVKILRAEFTNDEEFVKRFRIEAQAAASLSHPNIVSIFDVGHEDNVHYIVMELVDGITLKEYITRKGPLNWREAVNIAIQIGSAIEQAHKNHIVHRDIKPHNILLTREGIAKVTDFGIARAVSSSTITMVGSTIGSVHYFSPEQARGGFTDEKSDLYSMGIAIYEMITGKVPFDGESPVAVALKHIQTQPEAPVIVNSGVPQGVNDIVMKAIRKDQNARYQSASELLSDLQRVLREPYNGFAAEEGYVDEFPTRRIQAVEDSEFDESEEDGGNGKKGSKGRKKDRLSVWLAVATALIIGGVFFYVGLSIVIPQIMPEKQIFTVGDYKGKSYFEVLEELNKANIKPIEKKIFSDSVDKDVVISQGIAPGQTLSAGSSLELEISNGPELVKIPDLVNKETRIAEAALKEAKLVPKIVQEFSEEIPSGSVIRTEPAAEEEVRLGSEVIIYESQGPELQQVKVPNLMGLTRAEAQKLIDANGLTIGKLSPADVVSDVAKIARQFPLADSMVEEGTPVDLIFEIEPTAAPADNTGGTGQTGQDNTPAVKLQPQNIPLDKPDQYGEEIQVYIEAVPSDTNEVKILMDKKVSKDQFPLGIQIPVPKGGSTHIVVKLDGGIYLEFDELYSEN